MEKIINYDELLQDKKPIYLSGDMPMSINWLDKIDRDKLDNGILSCKYYNLSGYDCYLRTVNEQLEMKFYEYVVCDISLDTIIDFGKENNYDLAKSVYYWLLTESIKIKNESDNTGEHISDIKGFGIKCINNWRKKMFDVQDLINYLKNVEGLDVSSFKDLIICFPDGYDNGPFSPVSYEESPHHLTEMEMLIKKVIRENMEQ